MKMLAYLLRRSGGAVALAVLCGLISGAGSAGLISLINGVLTGSPHPGTSAPLAFAGIGAVMLAARVGSQLLLNRIEAGATFELRVHLSRRILSTPLRRVEELGTHRLFAILVDDVGSVTLGLMSLPNVLINLAIIAGCLAYLAWVSRWVFLALLAFLALGLLSYWVPTARSLRLLQGARQANDRLFKHLRALTGGLKELMLHRRRRAAFLARDLVPTAEELRQRQVHLTTLHTAASSWGMFLFFIFIGLLLFALPGFTQVSAQALVGYTLAALYLQQPMDSLMTLLPNLGRSGVALRHIEGLALEEAGTDGEVLPTGPAEPSLPFSRLELIGVTHTYQRENEDSPFTLGPIDLTLERGELVFIVGGNGSGKTTLAKLLTGLYAPEAGELRLDGQPVNEGNREDYRQHFSTVFSDFHLFDTLLGLAPAGLTARTREYLTRLQLDRKVSVDESGALSTTELSAGQRKRLALLTAWLEDRPIYLFDEWAADQDPAFKDVFYRELLPDLKRAGKTVVVITHDSRYFDVADRLVRLESGALIADEPAGPQVGRATAADRGTGRSSP